MRASFAVLLCYAAAAASPEERAVAYLAREVPRWSRENHCFSCHNNGDGARALYLAQRLGYAVPAEALVDSSRWLAQPGQWDHNGGDASSDKKMARVQFSIALAEGNSDRAALLEAADALLSSQERDGSWQIGAGAELGSPVTWGPVLATVQVRKLLERADRERYRDAIEHSGSWLDRIDPKTVPDAAAILLATGRAACLEYIRGAQANGGGWGPRPHAPPEAFDTALVLLALKARAAESDAALIAQGRAFLKRTQLPSGDWTETTRPAGAQSYAEHISTSAWATIALLSTHPKR